MGSISVTEAVAISGLTPQHLRRLVKTAKVQGRQTGENGVWLVDEESLRNYLRQQRRPGPKPKGTVDSQVPNGT
ncbi:helix-turn-helix domain-containing protein [Deinococcus apachensis]|uniref:helix-turn-helix domain-containing protein n=1 Tax=Deinococcus apachensis TaxID=309886 RepID=UPI0012FA5489|nr:helix-turn-helix domain-containing protein [Deinococcus apachensis]